MKSFPGDTHRAPGPPSTVQAGSRPAPKALSHPNTPTTARGSEGKLRAGLGLLGLTSPKAASGGQAKPPGTAMSSGCGYEDEDLMARHPERPQ